MTITATLFKYNDGGRSKYFSIGGVRDCVTRAVAIASGRDYKEVYDLIAKATKGSPRNGVRTDKAGFKRLMVELGFKWVPLMGIGTGCKVHLNTKELPGGRLVCSVSRHYTAVIDGVINDTFDCSRGGQRCVYGYWKFDK